MRALLLTAALAVLLAGCDEQPAPKPPAKATSAIETPAPVAKMAGWGVPDKDTDLLTDDSSKNYVVVFDGSGSMAESGRCTDGATKISTAQAAVRTWFTKIPAASNVALIVFDAKGTSERVPLARNDAEQVKRLTREVNNITASGGTPLGDSVGQAFNKLRQRAQRQQGYGEYHLVVVTDGDATDNNLLNANLDKIDGTPVIVHTIGLCINEKHRLNQPGRTLYVSATQPGDLERGLENILAESNDF